MIANQIKNMKKVMKTVANNNITHLQLSKNQLSRKLQKWYFVTIIVLTYCEKKLF